MPTDKVGRPPKFKSEFAERAVELCANGATDADLADEFCVTTRTIDRWKAKHGEFCQALKDSKAVADDKVERSLYQRAMALNTMR